MILLKLFKIPIHSEETTPAHVAKILVENEELRCESIIGVRRVCVMDYGNRKVLEVICDVRE